MRQSDEPPIPADRALDNRGRLGHYAPMTTGRQLPALAVVASFVALLTVALASVFGIEISHGDQVVNLGLLHLDPRVTGAVLLGLAAAVVVAGIAALVRRRARFAGAALAAVLALLILMTRAGVVRDAAALNEGTGAEGTVISGAVDGPISDVDASMNATLLMCAAIAAIVTAGLHCLSRTKLSSSEPA